MLNCKETAWGIELAKYILTTGTYIKHKSLVDWDYGSLESQLTYSVSLKSEENTSLTWSVLS